MSLIYMSTVDRLKYDLSIMLMIINVNHVRFTGLCPETVDNFLVGRSVLTLLTLGACVYWFVCLYMISSDNSVAFTHSLSDTECLS